MSLVPYVIESTSKGERSSSKFKIRAEKNKERYGSVAAAKALPRSQNSTR